MLLNAQFCPLSGEKGRPQFVPSIFPAQFPPHLEFLGARAPAQLSPAAFPGPEPRPLPLLPTKHLTTASPLETASQETKSSAVETVQCTVVTCLGHEDMT